MSQARPMLKILHAGAGLMALLLIATFWLSTVVVELFGTPTAVVMVKTAIPWGFWLLIPAMAAAGGSGVALVKGHRGGRVGAKLKRMPLIAANGLFVLIPAALILASKAEARTFDATFYVVQGFEILAGAVNIALLGRNLRDGLALTRNRRDTRPRR